MDQDNAEIERIFSRAADLRDAEERAAFLDTACGQDQLLRAAVERLLKHDVADSFLESPIVATPTVEQPSEQVGTYIGPYKLIEEIGEGGMGNVFMASQKVPVRRKVALKLIKPGMDSKQVVSRFEAERQALALMDHPGIARVFDGGSTASGRPYFVMELVRGTPITEYCDRRKLTTDKRLELFGAVCQAVQHAHQKGIIHRDLKPSNILVTLYDGKPVPKVIDFGIAKATSGQLSEATLVTNYAQMIGTPQYMSPEQAELTSQDVDTRSDVYSLGVLLYELLTGTTPLERERMSEISFDELRRIIREEEPPTPSTRLSTLDAALDTTAENRHTDRRMLTKQVSGELDWIVMEALEKDRTRRYESASDLAKDVERYLADEPVEACPPSSVYLLRKALRRHKTSFAFTATVALLLVLGLFGTTWQLVRATQAEAAEREQAKLAEANYVRAREAVQQMLTRVANEDLAAIPEMTEVRLQLMGDAELFYDELIKLNPNDAEAYLRRAEVRDSLGKPIEATIADFEKAIELAPRNATFHNKFSFFMEAFANDRLRSLELAKRSVELAPENIRFLGWLATIHSYQGEYDQALSLFERAFAVAPQSPDVYAARSNNFRQMGELERSLVDARKAVDLAPEKECGWKPLARVLNDMGDYEEALTAVDRAIEISGEKRGNDYLFVLRSTIHENRGNTDLALRDISRAIELNPRKSDNYTARAKLHAAEGRYDEALADIAKAIELTPSDLSNLRWIAPSQLATCSNESFRAGLLELADRVIELNDNAAGAYAARGWVLTALGQEEKALVDLKTAFDGLADTDGLGRLSLSDTCEELGYLCGLLAHRHEVIPYLVKIVELKPEDVVNNYRCALAQLGASQTDSYRDTCLAMVKQFQDTKKPTDGYWVAWTCLLGPEAVDDYEPVVRLAEQAVEADSKSAGYLNTLGAILYRAGRKEEAVERLTEAHDMIENPTAASTTSPAYNLYFLAMAHHKLGHDEEAEKWLDKANEWTDMVLRDDESGAAAVAWNRKLTLKLFREEAEELMDENTVAKEVQPTEEPVPPDKKPMGDP
jgi:serine/threonine protein kinase/Tfp pilus assembly protein PilF